MASKPIVTLKLLIDRKGNRVIFAEAGKEFVDFLFSFLLTPLGTITNLVTQDHMVGSVGRLYASVQSLSTLFLQPHFGKCDILDPVASNYFSAISMSIFRYLSKFYLQLPSILKAKQRPSQQLSRGLYRCNNKKTNRCLEYIADGPTECPSCKGGMSTQVKFIPGRNVAPIRNIYTDGYVKEEVTFMVKDDLEVKPMSGISSISLLSEFNLQNLEDLEERKVCMTPHEGLMILKASMQSKTVLTDVFLLRKHQVIADDEEDEDYLSDDMETDEDGNEGEETGEDENEDEETGEDENEDEETGEDENEDEETGKDGNEHEQTVKIEIE